MRPLRWLGFVIAIVVVLGIAVAGLVYANVSARTVRATSAQLVTQQYSLGTPYAGTIQDLAIARGDVVKKGEVLFRLQSPTLESAMQTKTFTNAGVGYKIEPGGVMVFTAARAGIVQKVNAEIGSFVAADKVVAVVAIAQSIHLESQFSLDARDYARIPVGGTVAVSMPDGSTVQAKIYDVEVKKYANAVAATTVLARSAKISTQNYMVVGAPVNAELHLKDDQGFGGWLVTQLGNLFTPGGFDR
jgi:multidrug efflux pump subunit AcrA (membrane-fusion protein)